jgi:hypothetical protein
MWATVLVEKDEEVKPYIQKVAKIEEKWTKISKRNINPTFLAILFSLTHGEGLVPKCS